MRILVAHNVSRNYPSGMMRMMQFTHQPLEAAGHEVEYFCYEDVPRRWNGALMSRFSFPWRVYRKAREAFEKGKPYHIVNVHEPVSAAVALLKKRTGARVFVMSHGLEHRAWQVGIREAQLGRTGFASRTRVVHPSTVLWQCRLGLTNADHVFCVSDDDRKYLKVHFGLPDEAITRVYCGALPLYAEVNVERDYSSSHRLLFAGTWRKNKGIEDLVSAITELLSRHPRMELRVLGGGIPKAELLSSFPEDIHSRIRLLQTKADAENAAIMADSDIFVLPSLFEGTPLTLMEAMASGLPIITTETSGMRDVISDGRNGLLIPTHSPNAIVRAVERLVRSHELRRELGTNAQQNAIAQYSWTAAAETVMEAYEKVLHPPAAPPSGPHSRRVLFAIHVPRDTDTAVYKNTRENAGYLEEQGCSCTIVSPADFPWIQRLGARFTPLLYPLALAWWLFRRAKAYDVAIFHSYAGWMVLALSGIIGRFRNLRSVIQFHGLESLYYARLKEESDRQYRRLSWRYRLVSGNVMLALLGCTCRLAEMVWCLNTQELRFLVDHRWTAPGQVRLLANPAPESFFISREHRPRATRLLFVGQWLSMKGTRYLADAFVRLHRVHPELELMCAGTLAGVETVRNSFPPAIRERVKVFPRVTKSELLELHQECDLFVCPTLSEGFSLALIEAMASGLPIVATPIGASIDILQDRHSVVFCPPHDAQALASLVDELIDDRARRRELGCNAQRAAEKYRPQLVWRGYLVSLNQLTERESEAGDRTPVASARERR